MAYASAYDQFEGASAFVEGTTHLTGNNKPVAPTGSFPGEAIEIVAVGGGSTQGQPELRVTVDCDEPTSVAASGSVTQLAGLHSVYAYGSTEETACDGPTEVTLPLSSGGRVVVGGPASASVSVYSTGDHYDDDYASWNGPVTLSGNTGSTTPDVEPNPDSRITIDGASSTSVTGTIFCDEPAMVDLSVSIAQNRGRTTSQAYGYDFIECDGETPFDAMVYSDSGVRGGQASVFVYTSAYRIEPGPDYPIYVYLWDDHQAASLRLRR